MLEASVEFNSHSSSAAYNHDCNSDRFSKTMTVLMSKTMTTCQVRQIREFSDCFNEQTMTTCQVIQILEQNDCWNGMREGQLVKTAGSAYLKL